MKKDFEPFTRDSLDYLGEMVQVLYEQQKEIMAKLEIEPHPLPMADFPGLELSQSGPVIKPLTKNTWIGRERYVCDKYGRHLYDYKDASAVKWSLYAWNLLCHHQIPYEIEDSIEFREVFAKYIEYEHRLIDWLHENYPDRLHNYRKNASSTFVRFNDHPHTTWDDLDRMFGEVKWEG